MMTMIMMTMIMMMMMMMMTGLSGGAGVAVTLQPLPEAGVGQTLPNVVPQKYHCNDHHHHGYDHDDDDDDDDLPWWSRWP